MNSKNKYDFKSIRFKVWGYFIVFAVALVSLIWFLQIFFFDNYYEHMKIKETTKLANSIVDYYESNDEDMLKLTAELHYLSANNDIYALVETNDGIYITSSEYDASIPRFRYDVETRSLREKLKRSGLNKISTIYSGDKENATRILAFACYLYDAEDRIPSLENMDDNHIVYIFSPLYPMKSTVSILRIQLIYITFIAILLALTISIYLANRISKPIKDITNSAAEMGKGNYGVTFKGGHYTEITDLAETLTVASQELEKTDMYQKDLIANVSHDLKTPLTMIKSYAEMIRDLSGNNPAKRESHLNVIIEEADRLNLLVNDMLSLSRMQSRKITLEKEDFDIREIATSLLASYDILAEQEGYTFRFFCGQPIIINGDPLKIKQVLSNLINNAVKYCGKDKQIVVNIRKVGKKMRCEVIDHGEGIAPDEINHVWEKYYKSSTHHVRATEGTGLGLSIVKEILILHKADYGVISKPGKGSIFWFEMDYVKDNKKDKKK